MRSVYDFVGNIGIRHGAALITVNMRVPQGSRRARGRTVIACARRIAPGPAVFGHTGSQKADKVAQAPTAGNFHLNARAV